MVEIDISLVKDHDFAILKHPTHLPGLLVVHYSGRIDNGITRKHRLEVQIHVALRCGLTTPVLGPVHAVGHQMDGCGINGVNRGLEAAKIPTADLAGHDLGLHSLLGTGHVSRSSFVRDPLNC